MKINKNFKRWLSRIIIVCILCTMIPNTAGAANDNYYTKVESYCEDGITYNVTYTYEGNNINIKISNSQSTDYTEIMKENGKIEITESKYVKKDFFGQKKFRTSKLYDSSDKNLRDNIITEAFGSKTYCNWKLDSGERYWYQKNSTSNFLYYKIGCIAQYVLNYTTLNSTYQGYMNNMVSYTNKCNSSLNKAYAVLGADVAVEVIAVVVVLATTIPPAGFAAILVSIFTGAAGGVCNVIDAYDYFKEVQHYYDIVKTKGVKQ